MHYKNDFRGETPEELDNLDNCNIPEECPFKKYFDKAPTSEYRNDFPRQSSPPGPPPSVTPNKAQTQGQTPQFQGQQSHQQGYGQGMMPGAHGHGQVQPKAVDQGSIRPCLYKYVYIWPRRGHGFWAWLTNVGRRSVSGYKWRGYRWVYFAIDLREIDSFECY